MICCSWAQVCTRCWYSGDGVSFEMFACVSRVHWALTIKLFTGAQILVLDCLGCCEYQKQVSMVSIV